MAIGACATCGHLQRDLPDRFAIGVAHVRRFPVKHVVMIRDVHGNHGTVVKYLESSHMCARVCSCVLNRTYLTPCRAVAHAQLSPLHVTIVSLPVSGYRSQPDGTNMLSSPSFPTLQL